MVDPLSIIGAVAGCQQILSRLTKVVKALAGAEKERSSIILRLDHEAILLQQFSDFLIDFESEFDSGRRHHFDLVMRHMQITLETTLEKMEKFQNKKSSRLLWAFVAADLKEAEEDLFGWSQRLMVAFAFLPISIKNSFVNRYPSSIDGNSPASCLDGLRANIRMEEQKSDNSFARLEEIGSTMSEEPTPWNNLSADQMEHLWIDRINTTSVSRRGVMTMNEVRFEVSRLFTVLRLADPKSNHILTAKNFLVTEDDRSRFAITSTIPDNTSSKQLLSDMLVKPSQHPLDHRVRVAREFVTAVAYVHAVDWVHKAVRPNNVLMLHAYNDLAFPSGLGHAFLVGFEFARHGGARSTGSGHWGWKDDIYRHPDRQNRDGVDLEIYYTTKHDIYSVGVVLLEIAVWASVAQSLPELKLADPDQRRRLLLDYADQAAGSIGSRYAALAKKCIAVDATGIDVQQVLTELQELRV